MAWVKERISEKISKVITTQAIGGGQYRCTTPF